MAEADVSSMVDEIVTKLETSGSFDRWLEGKLDASRPPENLLLAIGNATTNLLCETPPKVAHWERMLIAGATRANRRDVNAVNCCKRSIQVFQELLNADQFRNVDPQRVITFAGTLTLVLAGQSKLKQAIEIATGALCEKFPDLIGEMGQLCQDIWQRHGQMSGTKGLFVWDLRRNEWRLRQDFASFRPDNEQ